MDSALLFPFLAIEINVDPTMAEFGAFALTWPGFFTAAGIIAGLVLGLWLASRDGIPSVVGQELALVGVPAGIVGARLFYVFEHWGDFWPGDMADVVLGITDGGVSLWGGLIAGIAGATIYALLRRWPVAIAMDAAAPAIILGQAIGRIGDLLSGERAGAESGAPWAVRYTHPDTLADLGVSVHPASGGYEMIGGFLIFAIVLFVLRRWVRVPGWVFCGYLAMYGVLRFFVSYFRADEQTIGDVPVAQITSAIVIGLAIIGAGLLYRWPGPITDEWARRVWKREPEVVEQPPRRPRRKRAQA